MSFKKFFLVAALFLFSYISCLPYAQALTAGDIENHWAKRSIKKILNLGIMRGYPDGFFRPDQLITRAEFAKMIVEVGWIDPVKRSIEPTFQDIGWSHWVYPYVEAAVWAGIVAREGASGFYFEPERAITRSEAAAMAGRLIAGEHQNGAPAIDVGRQVNWMPVMKQAGIIYGYPDGALGEGNGLTRAEACAMVLRLKEKLLSEEADRERHWIASNQSPDGYIAMAAGRPDVIPYFGNLTGMAQLGRPQYLDGVKRYLKWYLSNLNYPDRWDLNGTIYDYRLENGTLKPVYEYDSADSYAATLLSLAAVYYRSSGDLNFIRERYRDLSAEAEVIMALQDADGLVWAKPNLQFKYLMDNCECYQGLKDWSYLLGKLGLQEQSSLYDSKAELIKKSILEIFWDENAASFAWALDQDGTKHLASPGKSYPGFFAQIYPVTFGVISPANEKAILAYQKLNEELPSWPELEVEDTFPWAVLGYAAAVMDDWSRVDRFLKNCRSTYILKDRCFPWSTFEGAFYIRACDAMRENIQSDNR